MNDGPGRILVVDDDAGGRYVKVHVLQRAGYVVDEAADGNTAVAMCAQSAPDLMVLDTRLPGMSGMAVCRRVKAAHPQVAVLQTSAALSSPRDRALALEGGADTFLVEPIEPEELLATVAALLRMRRAEQALRATNEHLEEEVAARTAELAAANQRLTVEIGERERTEEVLRHTQKMEAVGQLTGGIAHDFNNLLAVIVGSLGMVRAAVEGRRHYPQEKMLRLLNAAEAATDRGAKVTGQLLAFARRTVLADQVVLIDQVLAGCELFLRRAIGETVELDLTTEPGLWPSRLDPVQLEAAILNLTVNARDAMPGGGRLTIAARNLVQSAANEDMAPGANGDVAPGAYVRIDVTDTGTGMHPEIAKRVFEPFFTTKDVGHGTGLGLSQVYGFVTQSAGRVTVSTAPGKGTTFSLFLPRSDAPREALEAAPADDAAIGAPAGDETVLVVEDHPEVRELAVMTIADLGYQVLSAADGPEALDVLRGDAKVDLLFSDVVMPGGMNGFELVRHARALRSGIKALVTTGYAAVRDQDVVAEIAVLPKPYTRTELARRLRDTLAERVAS